MKNIYLLTAAIAVLCFASCGRSSDNPRTVADKFVKAVIVDADMDAALKYCTDDYVREIRRDIDIDNFRDSGMEDIFRDRIKEMNLDYRYNSAESEIGNSTAEIIYDVTSSQMATLRTDCTVELMRNADGNWRVSDFDFDLF